MWVWLFRFGYGYVDDSIWECSCFDLFRFGCGDVVVMIFSDGFMVDSGCWMVDEFVVLGLWWMVDEFVADFIDV